MWVLRRGPILPHLRRMVVISRGVPFHLPSCQSAYLPETDGCSCPHHQTLLRHHTPFSRKQRHYSSEPITVDSGRVLPHFSLYHSQYLPKTGGHPCIHSKFLQRSNPPFTTAKRYSSTEPLTMYEQILSSSPVHSVQSAFTFCHELTGFHWAGTIVATTLALRFALTFPLSIYSQNIRAKVESAQPEIIGRAKYVFSQKYRHRMKEEKWSEKRAQRLFLGLVRQQAKDVYVKENCHPAKGSILLLTQLPLWIMMSLSLRNMTGAFSERFYTDPAYIVSELSSDGALWFPDLTLPDPYLVLPITVGLLNLANIEMHALHKGQVSPFQRRLNYFLRGVSVVMIPIAAYVPSSLSLYWTVSAFYSFWQNIALKLPVVRRALKMTPAKSDSDTPFRDMRDVFVQRYIRWENGEGKAPGILDESLENVTADERKSGATKPK